MFMTAIKTVVSKTTGVYSRDVDSTKGNERIYDEVKDGYENKNQQRIQHLDSREGEKLTFK